MSRICSLLSIYYTATDIHQRYIPWFPRLYLISWLLDQWRERGDSTTNDDSTSRDIKLQAIQRERRLAFCRKVRRRRATASDDVGMRFFPHANSESLFSRICSFHCFSESELKWWVNTEIIALDGVKGVYNYSRSSIDDTQSISNMVWLDFVMVVQ